MTPAFFLSSIAFCFWLAVFLDRRRAWPSSQLLPGPGPSSLGAKDSVDAIAIVPARNEAQVLPQTLPQLLRQDHPGLHVVLVDDRSDDGTAQIARDLAEKAGCSGRLTVVEGSPAPPGWSGKVHALQAGYLEVQRRWAAGLPEWILLTDADIRHPRDSLRRLLGKAREGGRDLVSVMARLRAEGFWERLLIPPFVFFFQLLYPFRLASDPRSQVAAAAGGCILIRRAILEAAGGFPSIAGAIIDDVALARRAKRAGGRPWLGLDPEIASVRAYPRLRDIWRMVSRTAFVQLRHSYALLLLTAAAILAVLVAPPFLLLAGILGRHAPAALLALGAWIVPAAMILPSVRHHRVPPLYALALPAAGLLYLLMTLSSAWDHFRGRGPSWRGRNYGTRGRVS